MEYKDIKMAFDEYEIPVTFETVKEMVENEIKRLAKQTGLPGDKLPLRFGEDPEDNAIAYFRRYGDQPVEFFFNLCNINGLSANQLRDTVRHEFGHYVRLMRHGQAKNAHDKKWKAIGNELDYKPSTYYYPYRTKIFKV